MKKLILQNGQKEKFLTGITKNKYMHPPGLEPGT